MLSYYIVFLLKAILNRVRLWPLLSAVLLSLMFTVAPALAANETYTYKSTTDTSSFTAAAGGAGEYTAPVTFTKTTVDASGNATYVAPTSAYTCLQDGTAHTDALTVVIPAEYYKGGKSINGSIGNAVIGLAACSTISSPVINYPGVNPVTGTVATNTTQTCDQGSLSWVFCPVINNLAEHVSQLAEQVLTPLLQVNTINQSSTPQLYQVWTHVRDLADVLFILVFFAIIASTIMQQDIAGMNPYTIKTIWVRLIIAAVMVQFSFFISGLIVDFGNILGHGVTQFLSFITGPSNGPASISNYVQNLVATSVAAVTTAGVLILVTWEIALPVLLGLLLTLLVGILTLGARFLILSILIVVSPLACVAWVLPNTRHYMNDWFKLFFRLILMYPIIIGIFSLAGVINEILPFSTSTGSNGVTRAAVTVVKPLITIAMFILIPEAFRLAGKGLGRAYGFLNGASATGKGFLKNSQTYKNGMSKRKERQASIMQSLANNSRVTALTGGSSRIQRAAGKGFLTAAGITLNTSKSNPKQIQIAYRDAAAERVKTLNAFDNISAPMFGDAVMAAYGDTKKMEKIKREAPVLLEYMGSLAGRAALVTQANSMGVFGDAHERQILGSNLNGDFTTIQTALGKSNFNERPHIQRVDMVGNARDDYGEKIATYTPSSIATIDKEAIESTMGKKIVDESTKAVTYIKDDRSESFAKAWATNLAADTTRAAYSVGGRNRQSYDKRSAIIQMAGSNITQFKAQTKGKAVVTELMQSVGSYVQIPGTNAFNFVPVQENSDTYIDYYKNVLKLPTVKANGIAYDPQNNVTDRITMGEMIYKHLRDTP